MTLSIPGAYFDGKTSRRHSVMLEVREGIAVISGDVERGCPLNQLRVSERTRHGPRKITFPDEAYVEIEDHAGLNALLHATGYSDSLVVRSQQNWRATTIAIAATFLVLALSYLYLLPAAANVIAQSLPERTERLIGQETLELLDKRMFAPSELPIERQAALTERFRALAPPREDVPAYEILFRKSKIGPNALALPSGQIILTDEIVNLMNDDNAVMAILGHELGHLHERHLLRRLIQSSVIAASATLLLGDVSAVVANIPTMMLDLKYSRDAEREADDYAIAMLKTNGLELRAMENVFRKLEQESDADGNAIPPYLSSHPPGRERIERIRAQAQ